MKTREASIRALGFFVIVLTIAFGSVAWATLTTLEISYKETIQQINETEWILLRNSLALYLGQAKSDGKSLVDEVSCAILSEFKGDVKAIALSLDTYHDPDNKIREILTATLKGSYFYNIESDGTDPFITIGKFVELDGSDNCATFGSSRPFTDEYKMHANPYLAREMLPRIASADLENMNAASIDRPLFFQFVTHHKGDVSIQLEYAKEYDIEIPEEHLGKKALILDSYDINGLEKYFMETESWEETFYAFEFITPSYIYNSQDLAERRFVTYGLRTPVQRLAINIVFNYKTVIDHNPLLKKDLARFNLLRAEEKRNFIRNEKDIYLVIILLILICTLANKYTNKLALEIHDDRSTETV